MSAPVMHSDRPLWIILTVDVLVTAVAAVAAPSFVGPELRVEAVWTAALVANAVIWSGVLLVGLATWFVDFIEEIAGSNRQADFAPPVPNAIHEIIAASHHGAIARAGRLNAATRLPHASGTTAPAKQEELVEQTQGAN